MRQQHFSPRRGFRGGAATLSRERLPFGVVAALRGTVCPSWVLQSRSHTHNGTATTLNPCPAAQGHPPIRGAGASPSQSSWLPRWRWALHIWRHRPPRIVLLPPPCSARSVPPVVIVPSPISSLSLPSGTLRLLFRSLSRSSSLSCSAPLRLCGDRPPSSPIPPCPYSGSRIAPRGILLRATTA